MLKEKHLAFLFLLHATIQSLKWRVIQMGNRETCLWQMLMIRYGCPCNAIHSSKNKRHCCVSVPATSQNNPTRQRNQTQMGWCFCFKALGSKSSHLPLLPESEVLSSTVFVGLAFTKSCLKGLKLTFGLNFLKKKVKREFCLCKMSRSLIRIWACISHCMCMVVWVQGGRGNMWEKS